VNRHDFNQCQTAVLNMAAWVQGSYGFYFKGHLVTGSEHYTVK